MDNNNKYIQLCFCWTIRDHLCNYRQIMALTHKWQNHLKGDESNSCSDEHFSNNVQFVDWLSGNYVSSDWCHSLHHLAGNLECLKDIRN